jgi:hypothetical protein
MASSEEVAYAEAGLILEKAKKLPEMRIASKNMRLVFSIF